MNQYLELREYMMYLIIKKNKSKIKCKTCISFFIIPKNEWLSYICIGWQPWLWVSTQSCRWWHEGCCLFFLSYQNFTATSILNSQNWLWNRRALFKNYHTGKRHHFEDILDFHVPVREGRWTNYHSSVQPVKPSNLTLTNTV